MGPFFWERGFRPFFALAAVFAVFSVPVWVFHWAGWISGIGPFSDSVLWHAHEMIFGFTAAVMAGFLLTAVANWTGWAPVRGRHLAFLTVLWLAGRIALLIPGFPPGIAAILDCLFIPVLSISLFVPLWRSRDLKNFVFLGLLSALAVCDIAFFLKQDRQPLYIALLLVMTVVSVVAGRIVPSFTVAWARFNGRLIRQNDTAHLEAISLLLSLALVVAGIFSGMTGHAAGIISFALAFVHALRWRRYYPLLALGDPMLWILHAGFLWMIFGFAMLGLAAYGVVPQATAFHALTAGAIGSFVIGMMCRVTLGHTGRPIVAGKSTVAVFILMQLAAFLRVTLPLVLPGQAVFWLGFSGILWAACFAVYLRVYGPMLWQARGDGLPA